MRGRSVAFAIFAFFIPSLSGPAAAHDVLINRHGTGGVTQFTLRLGDHDGFARGFGHQRHVIIVPPHSAVVVRPGGTVIVRDPFKGIDAFGRRHRRATIIDNSRPRGFSAPLFGTKPAFRHHGPAFGHRSGIGTFGSRR